MGVIPLYRVKAYYKFSTMMYVALFALLSLASASDRIINGVDVTSTSVAPWQVSLQHSGSHFCGGSLIAAGFVMSACHCKQNTGANVVMGTIYTNQNTKCTVCSPAIQTGTPTRWITITPSLPSTLKSMSMMPILLSSQSPPKNTQLVWPPSSPDGV